LDSNDLLSAAIWIPIAFGLVLLALGNDRSPGVIRGIALVGALIGFLVTLPIVARFDPSTAEMQFVERRVWIDLLDAYYHLGVDGISVWFVVLTAFITVIVVIAGWCGSWCSQPSSP